MNRRLPLCLFLILFFVSAPAYSATMQEENQMLKARVAELEELVKQLRGVHPAENKSNSISDIEAVFEPALRPLGAIVTSAGNHDGGWLEKIRGGVDRADHYFFVPDSKAWATVEHQFDTRGFQTLNFTGASRLPLGFDVWGFVDFENVHDSVSSDADKNEFFMEIDIKRELWRGVGGIAEYNDAQGRNDNRGRFGVYYIPDLDWLKENHLFIMTKWFPLATDSAGVQGSFAWNWAPAYILEGRFSTGGFFDMNFNQSNARSHDNMKIVSETQLRYRVLGDLYFLLEYRFNEFFVSGKEHGWGIGAQYKF